MTPAELFTITKLYSQVSEHYINCLYTWGHTMTTQQRYEYAKKLYEDTYKDILPESVLDHYKVLDQYSTINEPV